MRQDINIDYIPPRLPFLQAICWQMDDVRHFTPDEMLDCYERGWKYNGVLADLENEELAFVRRLTKAKGSWLQTNV